MTKSDLIEALARGQTHLALADVEIGVKHVLDQMTEALSTGARIEVRGFGSFSLHYARRASAAIRNQAKRWRCRASTCRISSRARNCASGSTAIDARAPGARLDSRRSPQVSPPCGACVAC